RKNREEIFVAVSREGSLGQLAHALPPTLRTKRRRIAKTGDGSIAHLITDRKGKHLCQGRVSPKIDPQMHRSPRVLSESRERVEMIAPASFIPESVRAD